MVGKPSKHEIKHEVKQEGTRQPSQPAHKELTTHVIKPGECLASIASLHGFSDPSEIFEHEANANLREKRPNMHMLLPNDNVAIPPRESKTLLIQPGAPLPLVLKGKLASLHLTIAEFDGEALSHKSFELDAGLTKYAGQTSESGDISLMISATVNSAKLHIFLDEAKRNVLMWDLEIGYMQSPDSLSGTQARLNNLGFKCANEKGELDPSTTFAAQAFANKYQLHKQTKSPQTAHVSKPETLLANADFQDKLKSEYGC